jgi:fibronectin-binding autotransporter adhesin
MTTLKSSYKGKGVYFLLMLLSFSYSLSGATVTWTGTTSTSWNLGSNWGGSVPSAGDDVVIPDVSLVSNTFPVLDVSTASLLSLTIDNGATLTGASTFSVTVTGNMVINGTFSTSTSPVTVGGNISGTGTFTAGSANVISLSGNISVSNFTPATSVVAMVGSSLQQIQGGFVFYDLTINNSGAGIKLTGAPTVDHQLTMTAGNIDMNSLNLQLGNGDGTLGTYVGLLSYTSGLLLNSAGGFSRWFSTSAVSFPSNAGFFPLGYSGATRGVWIGGTPSAAGTITISHVDNGGTAGGTSTFGASYSENSLTFDHRNNMYWAISTFSLANAGTLSMRIQSLGGVSDYTKLNLSLAGGAATGSYSSPSGNNSSPEVNRSLMSASDLNNTFYIASTSTNPLPVILTSFSALYNIGQAELRWITASEMNNSYFGIERSADGFNWTEIQRVKGHGNSSVIQYYSTIDQLTDMNPANVIYYRLKQVDFNGHFSFSDISVISVSSTLSSVLKAWPNPSSGTLNLSWGNKEESFTVVLYDLYGRIILDNVLTCKEDASIRLDLSALHPGNYFLTVLSGNVMQSRIIQISE